jgi:predicted LPLAT superfamily acyltransferase
VSQALHWSEIRERGSTFALHIVVGFYRLFGRRLTLLLVHAITVYYYLAVRSARAASRAYLRRIASRPGGVQALGRRPDAVASLLHFRAFALSIFDRIALWFGLDGTLEYEVHGIERYDALLRPDRGAIVVGAHLGNFDALRALADRDGRVVNVLMFTRNARRINDFFRRLSPHVQVRVISAEGETLETALRLRACIERGELVALLGDRIGPMERGRSCRVSFLGDPVELPQAPYRLAALLRCPLFFMVALRSGDARYQVFAEVLAESVELPNGEREKRIAELACAYAARLEHYCALAPYEWFNFYDYWQEGAG